MFVLAVVCVLEARVPEHEQLHYHSYCKHVGLFGVLRSLLVDLWTGLHAGARDEFSALGVALAHEPLVCQSDDEVFVEQNVFGLEVIVSEASLFLEPHEAIHDLADDDADTHFLESIRVLELLEEFAVVDVLHDCVGVLLILEIVQRGVYSVFYNSLLIRA